MQKEKVRKVPYLERIERSSDGKDIPIYRMMVVKKEKKK